jgi:hypothetical protein
LLRGEDDEEGWGAAGNEEGCRGRSKGKKKKGRKKRGGGEGVVCESTA